ncbi:MAG: hypothetical protein BWY79_01796 [Actinobacteria bacterium ADurb.Bin444]|nr:MAG: hypothetical protein BWY79_01796 [Actinobacteria bacterium ADurb.Bin444]
MKVMETKALLLCLSADLPHATWGQGVELAQEWRGAGYAVKAVFIGPEGGRPSFGRPGDIGLEGIEVLPWAPPPVGLWCSPSMRESYGLYSWLRAGAGGVAGVPAGWNGE